MDLDRVPSMTAYGAAVHRAVHQDLEGGLVFADPLAWQILGVTPDQKAEIIAEARSGASSNLRIFIAARHRFAEDVAAEASLRGVDQIIVLGAGLDTFAYRRSGADQSVYEADLPRASKWKQDCLAEAGIPIPPSVHYVGADFENDDWLAALAEVGLAKRPTTVLWLGVVPYLSRDAVRATLAKLATIPGVEVVFDYPTPAVLETRLAEVVADLGEPFRSAWEPDLLHELLRGLGFDEIEDLGPDEIARRYLRREILRSGAGGDGRLVRARRTRWSG